MQSAEKQNLRESIQAARPHSSAGLTENLIRLTYELNANVIASYWPQPSEPDTSEFNKWVELMGMRLLTPRVIGESLEFAQGPAVKGAFGILEPTGNRALILEADLILVPALAIDRSGSRLGKGKGFYDRTLIGVKAPKYGVMFDSEFLDQIPTQDHDVQLDGSISPSAIRHLFIR
jgi:5-formyltetrahydrofolate cyclo-ligase